MGTTCAAAVVVTALAYGSPEDAQRMHAEADAKMAAVAADACGRRVTARIDWAALDTVDYHDESRDDTIGLVASTVGGMHDGLAKACQDPEVKANLAAVDTIVFVPTDKVFALDATILGSTLTFTTNIFGSTLNADEFANALAGAKLPDAPKASAPVKLGTPSSKWDATYRKREGHDGGLMCPSADALGDVKVSGGKLTIPWQIEDFRVDNDRHRTMLDIGRIDAVVHADGTGIGVVTFTNPALDAPDPPTVKRKRLLASVRSVALKFVQTDDGREFTFSIRLPGARWTCDYRWIWDDPKRRAATAEKREQRPSGNPFPEYGPRFSKDHYRTVDEYDSNTVYTRGTVVWRAVGGVGEGPYMLYYRCKQSKCTSGLVSDDWAPAGWQ